MTDICFLSIAEASYLIAQGELSPVELVKAHLKRIDDIETHLNSFITILDEDALSSAHAAEVDIRSGKRIGDLHGIPIGVKDLCNTKNVRTTIGSKIMSDFVPTEDATVVKRLKSAGAIIIGKLQMHEFAIGVTSENPHYGPAHNPWSTDRITGGSSGGSASSVASGQCMGAIGTDTGGSVRLPAALCGIVGLKPTFGRVSKNGVFPVAWNLDTVGPMTRTVRDAALMLNTISGHDQRDQFSSHRPTEDWTTSINQDIQGIRIGVHRDYFFDRLGIDVESSITAAADVLEGLGASITEVSIPLMDLASSISTTIIGPEAVEIHMQDLLERPEDFDPSVRVRLEAGAVVSAHQYIKAQRARTLFNRNVRTAMETVDVILSPTSAVGAPKIGREMVPVEGEFETKLTLLSKLTRPFNLPGVPTISLPCGFTSDGLPIGLQLSGRPFEEATILRVAHSYEQATEWHKRRPPI